MIVPPVILLIPRLRKKHFWPSSMFKFTVLKLIMCFYKQWMRLSGRKKFPQTTLTELILLKIQHLHTKKLLILNLEGLVRHPTLQYDVRHLTISTTTYWWSHLLSNGVDLFMSLNFFEVGELSYISITLIHCSSQNNPFLILSMCYTLQMWKITLIYL